jgi:uncharacterized protein (TIGR00251 family)
VVDRSRHNPDGSRRFLHAVIPAPLLAELRANGKLNLTLKVIPKSSRNEVVGLLADGSLKVKIAAAPEKGKANAAICDFLADEFGVPKRNIQIVRGETSATKHIVISCIRNPF